MVSFLEEKYYDNRYFIVFNNSVEVIARISFCRFWKWLNHSPYVYLVIFSELLNEVANSIIDWFLNDLEQPLWILCESMDVPDLFSKNKSKNIRIPSICDKDFGCLPKHFGSEFNKIKNRRRRKSFTNPLPRGEVIGCGNIIVIQMSSIYVEYHANTVTFPP